MRVKGRGNYWSDGSVCLSHLNGLKSDLMRCANQLRIPGYEGLTRWLVGAPHESGGKLLGIGSFEWETVNELFGFLADWFIRQHFPPCSSQIFQFNLGSRLLDKGQLAHSEQTGEGAAHFDGSRPPYRDAVGDNYATNGRGRLPNDTELDQCARVPKGVFHLTIAFCPIDRFLRSLFGYFGMRQSPEGIPIHLLFG